MIAGAHRDAHRMLGAFDGRLGPSGPEVIEFRSAADRQRSGAFAWHACQFSVSKRR